MKYYQSERHGNADHRNLQSKASIGEQWGFRRSSLPNPQTYFKHTSPLDLKGSGVWRDAKCPFHDDKSPSLRVNIEKGAFACLACGAKGGDVLAFHMQLHSMSFIKAAKALGAWEDSK